MGFSGFGTQTWLLVACGLFSDRGPVSPALAGKFLTTGPPLLKNLNALTLQATLCKVSDHSFTYVTMYDATVIHMPLINMAIFFQIKFFVYMSL